MKFQGKPGHYQNEAAERLAWPDPGYDARAIEGSDLDVSTAALLLAGQN